MFFEMVLVDRHLEPSSLKSAIILDTTRGSIWHKKMREY